MRVFLHCSLVLFSFLVLTEIMQRYLQVNPSQFFLLPGAEDFSSRIFPRDPDFVFLPPNAPGDTLVDCSINVSRSRIGATGSHFFCFFDSSHTSLLSPTSFNLYFFGSKGLKVLPFLIFFRTFSVGMPGGLSLHYSPALPCKFKRGMRCS